MAFRRSPVRTRSGPPTIQVVDSTVFTASDSLGPVTFCLIDTPWVCAYHTHMAATVIRTTYAFDEETVRRLESLARQWNVSKSEALRRAVRAADTTSTRPDDRLKALDELQASMRLTRSRAETWVRKVRAERRRGTARRLPKR